MTGDHRYEPPPADAQARLLLVASDERVARAIASGLRGDGFAVHVSVDVVEPDLISKLDPDLILVERLFPATRIDAGIDDIAALSRRFVVIGRNGIDEVVDALDKGADDYIASPQRQRELAARLRAVLRRIRDEERPPYGVVAAGDVKVDVSEGTVVVAGTVVTVGQRDLLALATLVDQAGRVVTHKQLAERVWGVAGANAPRAVSEQIRRIRARIEEQPGNPSRVVTVRCVGYMFVAQ